MQQLTSHTTAKALKDAGYKEKVSNYFRYEDTRPVHTHFADDYNSIIGAVSAPTLSEAADWLRSKGLHVYVECEYQFLRWYPRVMEENKGIEKFSYKATHDEALEFGINEAIKLLKNINQPTN